MMDLKDIKEHIASENKKLTVAEPIFSLLN
jgi:hypothetical protein